MKDFLTGLFSEKAVLSSSEEGLPYWIFWFLLCIILLLIIFIFLRDKDLRQRLNSFFFGIKKRMIKMRLQARLRMIRKKKLALIAELGRRAWENQVVLNGNHQVSQELADLDKNKTTFEKELNVIKAEITTLNEILETQTRHYESSSKDEQESQKACNIKILEARTREKQIEAEVLKSQKELEDAAKRMQLAQQEERALQDQASLTEEDKRIRRESLHMSLERLSRVRQEIDKRIHTLVEDKAKSLQSRKQLQNTFHDHGKQIKAIRETHKKQISDFEKEIHEWEKNHQKVLEKITKIEKNKIPLFEDLGTHIEQNRVEHKSLVILYSKIDRRAKRISDIESRIQKLDQS